MTNPDHIKLNRQFVELNAADVEMLETEELIELGLACSWLDLLSTYRVVILSAAGTGKTREIQYQCEKLCQEGKPAFFLRLEDLASDWEIAFEIGEAECLDQAIKAGDEIWIFLDSIDEARLKGPGDFKRALKRLKLHIKDNLQNTHIVLTSRTGAWRPREDAARLDDLFPYNPPQNSLSNIEEDDDRDIEWDDEVVPDFNTSQVEEGNHSSIKYYTLLPLDSERILLFAKERELQDASAFTSEIRRLDMQSLAGRPKDLDDLIQFWHDHGRLGNRREIIEENIKRKLTEDDPDRAEQDPLSIEKAWVGAKKLAATVVLTHHSKIIVPDQPASGESISVQSALADWSPKECSALLGRPIFEPQTYGFFRFDHRDSREFLAARWFFDLMENGQSRRRVEQLFFKTQYDIDVVVPNLRPILPWLAIFDYNIRRRVMDNWPEILLEGGDASELPPSDRKELLKQFCKRHAAPESQFWIDFNALQRLVTPELGPTIRKLYAEYKDNKNIEILLLRSIELGLLRDLADIAETATLNPSRNIYARLSAMRAISAVCDEIKIASVCDLILKDNDLTSRQELANVLDVFGAKYIPAKSLMNLVEAVDPQERYSSDYLNRAVTNYINTCTTNDLEQIVSESARLVQQAPLIKRDFFDISKKNGWMLDFAATACERLIKDRHPTALLHPCLTLLSLDARSYDYGIRETRTNLGELVPQWPEINAALFWYDVQNVRALRNEGEQIERVTTWWQAGFLRNLWRFESKDTDQVVGWIKEKEFIDDRLVALTLAFSLYRDAGRPRPLRRRLWRVVDGSRELSTTLKRLLNPPPMSDEERRLMRSATNWKQKQKKRARKNAEYHNKWREELPNLLERIQEIHVPSEDSIWNAQQYLFGRMRTLGKDQNQWTRTNWQDLKPEFGDDVAEAMRDGLMSIWRRYNPTLASEAGKRINSTPIIEIMALSGLEIESREAPDWPTALNDNETQRVARYLMSELNGFPTWFRAFEAQYPDITLSFLLKEAVWDLFDNPADGSSHYLLDRIFWHAAWFGDRIAPRLVPYLLEKKPRHISVLADALALIIGCEAIGNDQIARLCSRTIIDVTTPQAHHPLWSAAWVSVDPLPAIDDLTTRLAALEGGEAVETAIAFINALYGSHHESRLGVRGAHKTPEHLRRLYSLIHQYVRSEDDIDRSNGGVFCPTSRDQAQDARRCIYDNLADIPGKKAFDALVAIAQEAPSAHIQNWLYSRAVTRAQADADTPWTIDNVNEFADKLERTPSNSYELFEVAINRLMDLKYNYEEGDTSPSNILVRIDREVDLRNYLADKLRETAHARYSISQEEEFPNDQRTDIRFVRAGIPGMVPVELKIADKWSGPELFTKLEKQLCGDYMRDVNSTNGIYLLVRRSGKNTWQHPDSKSRLPFEKLIAALQCSARDIIASNPGISNIEVIGIDLTKRKKFMQN